MKVSLIILFSILALSIAEDSFSKSTDIIECGKDLLQVINTVEKLKIAVFETHDIQKIKELAQELIDESEKSVEDCKKLSLPPREFFTTDRQTCFNDITALLEVSERFIVDIENKDYDAATKLLPEILEKLQKVEVDCKHTIPKAIGNLLKESTLREKNESVSSQQLTGIPECLKDVIQLFTDVQKIEEAVNSKDINELVSIVKTTIDDALKTETDCKGVVSNSQVNDKIDDIVDCMDQVEIMLKISRDIYVDFKKKDYMAILSSLPDLIYDGQDFIRVCKKVINKVDVLMVDYLSSTGLN